ncbi:hypothetical protein FNV43_RR07964 [Rhamnella rubrinervis]|uniref:Uncharacterized protein n=1 Tax=Rhamnella rubrinervis TaxID=2594499 RepID=A0A8K0MN78_9ROSA|nr:hypothetical protein FNV43_RR07964 [Rhamnella rubrinervis]
MDNNIRYENLQAGAKFNNLQLLRRTLQVVVWLSLLSLFLCYSTGVSLFPNSFSIYFSTYLFSLFTRTLERKYMFLICNGLLALLAKSSSVSCSSPLSSPPLDGQSELGGQIPSSTDLSKIKESVGSKEDVPFVSEEGEENQKITEEEEEAEEQAEDQGSEYLFRGNYSEEKSEAMKEEDEDNVEDGSGLSPVKQEGEVEGTTTSNEELASTEEMNKKFEEFIRKMKEEIRIEAQQQQQLIAAA